MKQDSSLTNPASGPEEKNKSPMDLPSNFIQDIISADLKAGKNQGRVHTRFPPSLMATCTLDMPSLSV
jgi:hypothetical protein